MRRIDTAFRQALAKISHLGQRSSFPAPDFENQTVPPEMYQYFFDLQVQVERTGRMDYHAYCERLWAQYMNEHVDEAAYRQFEANLIRNLQLIDMHKVVEDDVHAEKLVSAFGDLIPDVRQLIVWSTGDVSTTGYQDLKIARSGVARELHKALGSIFNDPKEAREYMRTRTRYIVADDKKGAIKDYWEGVRSLGLEPKHIVVVEDSLKNLGQMRQLVAEVFGDAVQYVPVWATYTRAGHNARREMSDEDYADLCEEMNAIDRFSDLNIIGSSKSLDLASTDVVIDFDGVLADNIRMRNAQAQVIYDAIVAAQRQILNS